MIGDKIGRNYTQVECSKIKVGDIVEIQDGEIIPADLILLTCKTGKKNAFVKTAQLDGETNLKPKIPIRDLNETYWNKNPKDL